MRGVARDVPSRGGRKRLLSDIDIEVRRGALTHIVGPSGAGKSCLVRLINRLDEPTAGRIEILGRAIADWPPRELRTRVGMAFQEPTLLGLSVRENLQLPFELGGNPPADLDRAIEEVLDDVGLEQELLDRDGTEISVGQKQRVALARALITRPDVLVLDEPTSSLDARTADRLLDRLARIRERHRLTIVMATHRLSETVRLGGDMVLLIDGRIEAAGPVDRIVGNPPTPAARRFLLGEDRASG